VTNQDKLKLWPSATTCTYLDLKPTLSLVIRTVSNFGMPNQGKVYLLFKMSILNQLAALGLLKMNATLHLFPKTALSRFGTSGRESCCIRLKIINSKSHPIILNFAYLQIVSMLFAEQKMVICFIMI